ncbi:hypothetical protein ma398 [Moumouvirus australiensis]|uniref:Uncharacterized protein n=1 Tax=Moumouvirus australiensis TaxID=2109587 RepID=A0A2P1ELL2_9VIRU|nr:hypothetical protein QKC55_gp507 [Moumouvirus australiensis]AVL94784.1 hypothetical protein ma398 [Moumouvirus australiensis]
MSFSIETRDFLDSLISQKSVLGDKLKSLNKDTKKSKTELEKEHQDTIKEISILDKYILETQNSLIKEENRIINEILLGLGKLELVKSDYLTLCLQVLFTYFPYNAKNLQDILKNRYTNSHLNVAMERYFSMTEKEIIILAHQKYNYFLVRNNGPYYFYHNHGSFKECEYDGISKRCECSCKCPEWDTSYVDWLKFSFDEKYPVGEVKCGW